MSAMHFHSKQVMISHSLYPDMACIQDLAFMRDPASVQSYTVSMSVARNFLERALHCEKRFIKVILIHVFVCSVIHLYQAAGNTV